MDGKIEDRGLEKTCTRKHKGTNTPTTTSQINICWFVLLTVSKLLFSIIALHIQVLLSEPEVFSPVRHWHTHTHTHIEVPDYVNMCTVIVQGSTKGTM